MSNNHARPLSPHLTIYKPQITSMLSITHRLTGVAVYFATLIFAWILIVAIYGDKSTVIQISDWFFECKIVKILLFLWSYAIFFHLFTGIRHLVWDTGTGLDMPTVRRSGWLVIILAIVSTIAAWNIVL